MDEKVIKYYRKLLKEGFQNAGSIENPSIVLDTVGEKIRICGHTSQNRMYVYIAVYDDIINDIKYLCNCDPTANVIVEILCILLKGRPLSDARKLSATDFSDALGSTGDAFMEKSKGMVKLLQRGIQRYSGQ